MTIRQALLLEELFQPDEKHNFVACRLLSHRAVADSACTANEGSTAVDAHGPVGKRTLKEQVVFGPLLGVRASFLGFVQVFVVLLEPAAPIAVARSRA